MSAHKPPIRYCSAPNGLSIAWAAMGHGPALVHCSMFNYFDAAPEADPGWAFLEAIARGRMLISYDGLGTGLSDRSFVDLSIEQSVADLLAVVDAAGVERFALFAAMSGAQGALAFAARYPQRVESLFTYCGIVRGFNHRNPTAQQVVQREAMLTAFFVLLPALMLSGYVFPIENMPEAVQWLTLVNPLRYYIELTRGIVVKGASVSDLWSSLLALAALGALVLWGSAQRFRKRIEQETPESGYVYNGCPIWKASKEVYVRRAQNLWHWST